MPISPRAMRRIENVLLLFFGTAIMLIFGLVLLIWTGGNAG